MDKIKDVTCLFVPREDKQAFEVHFKKFSNVIEQINKAPDSNETALCNFNDVCVHVWKIGKASSPSDKLALIEQSAPSFFTKTIESEQMTLFLSELHKTANLKNLDAKLLNVEYAKVIEELTSSINNLSSIKQETAAYKNGVISNSPVYNDVVESLASFFGGENYKTTSKLVELSDFLSDVFVFSVLEHRIVIVIGVTAFSKGVYSWCMKPGGFHRLISDVTDKIYWKYTTFTTRLLDFTWKHKYSLALVSATGTTGLLTYFRLNPYRLLQTRIWFPFIDLLNGAVYKTAYSVGKAATPGLFDSFCDHSFVKQMWDRFWSEPKSGVNK